MSFVLTRFVKIETRRLRINETEIHKYAKIISCTYIYI